MKKNLIGFDTNTESNEIITDAPVVENIIKPRKSVVSVYFPQRNLTLSYYNDMFDLHNGDIVYVEGKLEGYQGKIVEVHYSFKIKISDYKKVIAVVDTKVRGDLHFARSHMVSFDRSTIPYEKVKSWYIKPDENEEYVMGEGGKSFALDNLKDMEVFSDIAARGHDYYVQNRVLYVSVDNGCGKAIVDGSNYYEVEFTYNNGMVSDLVCDCFCNYTCKHQVAVMLQLKECLDTINKEYSDNYNDYFAAISKDVFVNKIFANTDFGKISL